MTPKTTRASTSPGTARALGRAPGERTGLCPTIAEAASVDAFLDRPKKARA